MAPVSMKLLGIAGLVASASMMASAHSNGELCTDVNDIHSLSVVHFALVPRGGTTVNHGERRGWPRTVALAIGGSSPRCTAATTAASPT